MDLDDLSCEVCKRQFTQEGELIPRLLADVGVTYCTACLQSLLNDNLGKDAFFCEDEPE